jgi:RNA polymerase sigma-70 factor (ECF subfamily)
MKNEFLSIVKSHQAILYKVCRLYRDQREDEEDLFQEIVFQLWKSWPHFRGESKVTTWMYRIALNTALASYRKRGVALSFIDAIPEHLHPEAYDEPSENEQRMYDALKTLAPPERAIVSLFLEEYSYKEIGEMVGITENYVGVQMSRIKQKLKTILNQY